MTGCGSPSSRKRSAHSAACSFSAGHAFQRLLAARIRLPLGKGAIGVVAGHLRLPVLFQNLAQPRVTGQRRYGVSLHSFSHAGSLRL